MNFRTTLVLALLAIAAAIVVVILSQHEAQDPDDAQPVARKVFLDVDQASISRVTITPAGQGEPTIVIQRDDGPWRLRQPVDAPVDRYQAGTVATALAAMSYERAIPLDAAKGAEFGLVPPQRTVTFRAGDAEHTLHVGRTAGFGRDRFTYVRLPDDDRALLIDQDLLDTFAAELSQWRSDQLVPWRAPEVSGFTLTTPEGDIEAERAATRWFINRPVNVRGDAEAAGRLVRAAANLSAESFVDQVDPATAYGFEAPRLVLTLVHALDPQAVDQAVADPTTEPERETLTLTFGNFASLDKDRVFVRVGPDQTLATVKAADVAALEKTLFDLRDKQAVDISPDRTTYLSLDVDGEAVALERSGDGAWRIAAPTQAPADGDEVRDLLDALEKLRVTEFRDGIDDPAAYGLDTPMATITYRQENQAGDTSVRVGAGGDGAAWIALAGGTSVGKVDAKDVRKLKTTWLDVRSRTVWQVSDDERISAVRWTRGGETIALRRRGAGGDARWTMTAPVEDALDQEKVDQLLDVLRTVEAREFLASADKAAEFGLDGATTRVEVTIEAAGGGSQFDRRIDIAEHEGRLVAIEPNATPVFRLDGELLDALGRPLSADPWLGFQTERVHRFEVSGPDVSLVFNRAGDDWASEDSEMAVDAMKVGWVLGDLSETSPEAVVAYAAEDLAEYGLETPEWRFHVEGLGVDTTVLISAQGPDGGRYATLSGSGRVVVVDGTQVSRLAKDAAYYRVQP